MRHAANGRGHARSYRKKILTESIVIQRIVAVPLHRFLQAFKSEASIGPKGQSALPATDPEMPCIRCGACAEVCPAQLQPQGLLMQLRVEDFGSAETDGLFACTECGRCDPVCPSRIRLLDAFRQGKDEICLRTEQLATADAARERFESRQQRLQREVVESAARQSERKAQVASPDAVTAALERAKAKRRAQGKDADS
jgi:electron transport complex protein RnfC